MVRFILYLIISYAVLRYSLFQVERWPKNVSKLYYEQYSYIHFVVSLFFLIIEFYCYIECKVSLYYVYQGRELKDLFSFSAFFSTLCTISEKVAIVCHDLMFTPLLNSTENKMTYEKSMSCIICQEIIKESNLISLSCAPNMYSLLHL